MVSEYLTERFGRRGKVAVIRSILGIFTHEERIARLQEAFAPSPKIRLVTIQPANGKRVLRISMMENIPAAHPDVAEAHPRGRDLPLHILLGHEEVHAAVSASTNQMALGTTGILVAQELTGSIVLVGFDATQEAIWAVKVGRLQGTVAGQSFKMCRLRSMRRRLALARVEGASRPERASTSRGGPIPWRPRIRCEGQAGRDAAG